MQLLEKRDDLFTVSVLGEFASGKSTLVNALFLKDDILPRGSGVTTSVPAEIIHGDRLELKVVTAGGVKTVTDAARIKEIMAGTSGAEQSGLSSFKLTANNQDLVGIRVIDTPGLNAPNAVHKQLTEDIIARNISDLVLWVIDLQQGATASNLELLERLKNAHYRCVLIANHADKVGEAGGPQAVQKAMAELGKKAYMFPKLFESRALDGLRGAKKNDRELFSKAGMENIIQHILAGRQEWTTEQATKKKENEQARIRREIERLIETKQQWQKKTEEFHRELEKFISQKALKALKEAFLSDEVKKKLAKTIDWQVDQAAENSSPTFSSFRFLLGFKNEGFPYVSALLAAHIALSLKEYGDSINDFINKEMEGMKKNFHLSLDSGTFQLDGAPISGDPVGNTASNVLGMIVTLIGAITAGISAFFIQTTVTYLWFFTATVWNPVGIAVAIVGGLAALIGLGILTPVADKIKKEIKEKFGVPQGHGIFNQIWFGGTIDSSKELNWTSKLILKLTDAGEKLLFEMEHPPTPDKMMLREHVDWAMEVLGLPAGEARESLVNTVMSAMKQGSMNSFGKNNIIPPMENERLYDFKRIWEGLDANGQPITLGEHGNFTGLKHELQRIVQDIDSRIENLKKECPTFKGNGISGASGAHKHVVDVVCYVCGQKLLEKPFIVNGLPCHFRCSTVH